ncbi:MAG: hypothetical protein O2964_12465, partial [Verrucomicrobia bacterium]|nr:hypothetical protein [Verrucomicrobiota bacterium]
AQYLFAEADRMNTIEDPMLTGISRDFDAMLDPRPTAGSPALSNALNALPGDSFFMPANHQGAFSTWNWLAGWSALASGGYITNDEGTIPSMLPEGVFAMEDFESLPLGPNVNEELAGENVWTKETPRNMSIDDSGVAGVGNDETDGVTEWAGWSFANKEWWTQTAGDQRRSEFVNGIGTVAIADGDEWDDQPHAEGYVNTFLSWDVDITGATAGGLELSFDSSWRPEYDSNYHQTANITASYDGGEAVQVMLWESNSDSPNYKDHTPNEAVILPLDNPAGAKNLTLTFGYFDAGNDWWAIDNLVVAEAMNPATIAIARDGANITIEFDGTLQSADSATGPYKNVDGASSPFSVTADAPQKFYRAVR